MPDLPLPEKDTGEATASDCGTAPDTERELPASGPAETHPALPEPDEAKLPESPLERGVAFDRAGFLPGVGEAAETFFRRVEETLAAHRAFEEELAAAGELVVFEDIRVSEAERIPAEIIAEADEVTGRLYDFRVSHVPGFFLSRDVGMLWGGCLIGDTEQLLSIFLIRGAFRNRERWLFYNRRELLAHELCHSMRQSLHDPSLEEYFAYQTSPSPLRRYLGNCFIHDYDAILFVVPALLLLLIQCLNAFWLPQLPTWPAWPLAFAYPLFLLIRNGRSRHRVKRAAKALARMGVRRPEAVLFRSTAAEIAAIGALPDRAAFDAWVRRRAQEEFRWEIIRRRFLDGGEGKDENDGGETDETC